MYSFENASPLLSSRTYVTVFSSENAQRYFDVFAISILKLEKIYNVFRIMHTKFQVSILSLFLLEKDYSHRWWIFLSVLLTAPRTSVVFSNIWISRQIQMCGNDARIICPRISEVWISRIHWVFVNFEDCEHHAKMASAHFPSKKAVDEMDPDIVHRQEASAMYVD